MKPEEVIDKLSEALGLLEDIRAEDADLEELEDAYVAVELALAAAEELNEFNAWLLLDETAEEV